MLNIRQYVFWLVLCCIITGRASSADDSAVSPPSESLAKSGNGKSDTDSNPEYDPGTSSLELQGRLALVTGGASGIGRSVAMVLARENVTVIVADINQTGGEETIVYLKMLSSHLRHRAMYVDVRNSTSVGFLIQCIERGVHQYDHQHCSEQRWHPA
uniref:Putative conserved secreted protein n=1 Tax=Ixodes ricinus TaxID=34613 RepID=V5H8H7_IXORI